MSLRERYEPLRTLGAGAEGRVLEAIDRVHDRRVALKVRRLGPDTDRERVLREARTLLGLRPHPGVALARDDFFEEVDGEPSYVLVMDWIEGVDLAQTLAAAGPRLPVDVAISYLAQIAAALDHIHAHDVVHRDVKPSNIVVRPDGSAVLVDFGISASVGQLSRGGTSGFRAPETVTGHTVTPATDIYGLAATAWFLLTGRPPSIGEPAQLFGDDAERLVLVFAAALAFDPQRRPRRASEFVDALRPPATPTNLPRTAGAFIGRADALEAVLDTVGGSRIVTIVGAGGSGKTRLAVETGRRLLTRFPDGLWFVDLSTVVDPSALTSVVAAACQVPDDRLLEAMASGRRLLILDGCEHMAAGAADLVATLIEGSAALRVIATSRQPLGLAGERTLDIPSLQDSTELFMDRARAALPGFDGDPDMVAAICAALDRLPLGIELAAARVESQGLDEILRSASADMTETVAWSAGLLSGPARRVLQRVSVFAGGFSRQAAEDVCGFAPVARRDVVDLLARLVNLSLVQRTAAPDGVRYGLLDTIRAFARESLTAEMAERHFAWFLDLAERSQAGVMGADQASWLDRMELEHANLRAALGYSLATPVGDRAARMAGGLADFWYLRGHIREGQRWLATAGEGCAPSEASAKALSGAALLHEAIGEFTEAHRLYQRSLDHSRAIDHHARQVVALRGLGSTALRLDRVPDARRYLEESVTLARAMHNTFGTAAGLVALGNLALGVGDRVEARAAFEESLPLFRSLGNERAAMSSLHNLAVLARDRGDLAEARTLLDEVIDTNRTLDIRPALVEALIELGLVEWDAGNAPAAAKANEEALQLAQELDDRRNQVRAKAVLGLISAATNDRAGAASMLDQVISELADTTEYVHLALALFGRSLLGGPEAGADRDRARDLSRAAGYVALENRLHPTNA